MQHLFSQRVLALALCLAGLNSCRTAAATLSAPSLTSGHITFASDTASGQLITLQSAPAVTGPWTDSSYYLGAGNPINFAIGVAGSQRFFRVRVTPATALELTPKTPLLPSQAVSLPDVEAGAPYLERVTAGLSGLPPYTLQLSGTALDGVTLSVISNGTANATVRVATSGAGVAAGQRRQFTVSATDSAGANVARTYDVRAISPAPVILSTSVLMKAGAASSVPLTVTNGTGPLAWSLISGPMPEGISFSGAGVLSGVPITAAAEFLERGRHTNLVRVVDSHTDRLTGAPAPRAVTKMVVMQVRLSWKDNLWADRVGGPSLGSICIVCHGAAFSPNLSAQATNFIGFPSAPLFCSDRTYIVPGDPEQSLIFQKLRGPDCGERMPLGGPYFEGTQLERLRRWVQELTPTDTD